MHVIHTHIYICILHAMPGQAAVAPQASKRRRACAFRCPVLDAGARPWAPQFVDVSPYDEDFEVPYQGVLYLPIYLPIHLPICLSTYLGR